MLCWFEPCTWAGGWQPQRHKWWHRGSNLPAPVESTSSICSVQHANISDCPRQINNALPTRLQQRGAGDCGMRLLWLCCCCLRLLYWYISWIITSAALQVQRAGHESRAVWGIQRGPGTHRMVPLLLLHFSLDLSQSYLHFQSCCCLYLLLSQSGFRCPSCLPGQGFLAHNPWHFFGQTWQKHQRSISCCALVFFPRWLLSSVLWRQTRKCPNYRELCKEFIFFNMIESEKEKSCNISSDQTNPN